ncbi:hypothetical protein [Candidatus Aciduliprofundum boonei]|uniref:Uncharacterized protein n=1 Tax=Aciduliprofundum boonei (strain DSM 19572 / T469) TaxID=439481 RepID=B5IHF0_ACIB4|nr:hypothetical protein [Candidatus Aciduliprofundum boonei]ADD08839.1 hypothetical protein Aboo_1030 [Aciduliprofundum boonei T469]EDY34284.1 hypothetical protein ABOONEI_2496 [Aciduliprofundum boonei T469]
MEDEETIYLNIFGLSADKEHAIFKKVYEKSGLIVIYAVQESEE